MTHAILIVLLLLVVAGTTPAADARTLEIFPSNADATCNEEFENVASTLQPGDELILHGGVYTQRCRRLLANLHGTAESPIIIRAAVGETPILTRPGNANFDFDQNNIEIESCSYLILRGLVFQGGDIGVRFMGTSHHVTFEDNEIAHTGNSGLTLNSGNFDALVIRRNHIHHTGRYTLGPTEGEGMYVGCNNATCLVSNSVIENNYIHDLRGTSSGGNDGIEIKPGSYGNVVRDNVIHDTTIGTRYPCIFVYGGGVGVNIVEGNALWNCGEAIQVVADAVVRNNLILYSDVGVTAAPHAQVPQVRNVTIVNNTIYGHGECMYIRWSGALTTVLGNNAIYCPGATAVDASGLATSVVRSNHVAGGLTGASLDGVGFLAGGDAAAAFVDPAAFDFWPAPASILRTVADASLAPGSDFNGTPRVSPYDVGAYESNDQPANPGWTVTAGFKNTATTPPPPPPDPAQIFTLSTRTAGRGTGTVTSSPAGIDCGSDCSEGFTVGTVVTLTATPNSASTFAGWSGDADCADGMVVMSADKTCTATFKARHGKRR